MIELRHLTKRFGALVAVDDLTLTVNRGEIFGLLGHNGAGKSTAIGMMLGQVWPSGGEVHVCGHDVTSQRQPALQRVGAIFETPAFYDYLSGWRNLEILSQYTAPTPAGVPVLSMILFAASAIFMGLILIFLQREAMVGSMIFSERARRINTVFSGGSSMGFRRQFCASTVMSSARSIITTFWPPSYAFSAINGGTRLTLSTLMLVSSGLI